MRILENLAAYVAILLFGIALVSSSISNAQTAVDVREVQNIDPANIVMERSFVDGPFGQIHIRTAKPAKLGKHPPLILFHPTPYSGDYFSVFMKEMARDRVIIAIDTPGYGDSERAGSLLTIRDYAASAAAALHQLGYGGDGGIPVDMLGYHTGGLIAVELAVIRPDLVRRIALPGLPFYVGEERKEAYDRNAKPDVITKDGSHLISKWKFSTGATDVGLSSERGQEHFNDAMQCYQHCWEAYHAVFTYETEKRLAQVTQPVLLITNAGSLKAETEAAQKYISNSKLVHMPQVTLGGFDLHTKDIAKIVRKFLDR